MDKDTSNALIGFIVFLLLLAILGWRGNAGDVRDYRDALKEANQEIEQTSNEIDNAKAGIGSADYDELFERLDNLETPTQVEDPHPPDDRDE
jgi:hypothetical protein